MAAASPRVTLRRRRRQPPANDPRRGRGGAVAATQDPPVRRRAPAETQVVVDLRSEHARLAKELRRHADRAKLFSGAAGGGGDVDVEAGPSHVREVLQERKHTTNALRQTGDTLEQARETRADLAAQREALEGSTATAAGMLGRLPTIDGVIQAMRQKKVRENAVVGVTIGCCASFLLWAVLF